MAKKHLQKMLAEAEKLKVQHEKELLASTRIIKASPTFALTPPDDETWRVYRALFGSGVGFVWFLPAVLLPVAFMLYSGNNEGFQKWSVYYFLFCAALPLSRFIYLKLRLFAKFEEFRGWRSRLPFVLEGWEDWVDAPNFHKMTFWRMNATIRFVYTPSESINDKTLQAIWYVFCQKANRYYYYTDDANDSEKWTFTQGEARGSLNNHIVYTFYKFIQDDIVPLVRQEGGITKIILSVDKEEYERDLPSTD